MKTRIMNQKGFGHVVIIFVVLFVAVAGLAGYKVMTMHNSDSSNGSAAAVPKVPATITSKADLTAAAKALDSAGVQLNSSLDDSALNSDLNDLL